MYRIIFLFLVVYVWTSSGCANVPQVSSFDQSLLGVWYVTDVLSTNADVGCDCHRVEITLDASNQLTLDSKCTSPSGAVNEVYTGSLNGNTFKMKSTSDPSIEIDFIVTMTNNDNYGVIYSCSSYHEYGWILTRSRQRNQQVIDQVTAALPGYGITASLVNINQDNCDA